jgi:hypothetical protein
MIPSAFNSDYPRFVANQVLTSDNLNDLFGYLDEQQRLTRTNLLGIGIVCGLQVKTGSDSDGSFITITEGCGITSLGYLVTVPEITYHQYNQFDAVKSEYYAPFVNTSDKTQKFPLWELKQLGEIEDEDNPFHLLTDPSGFLNDKIVLIFVELLETANKNCDPNSCDDKGIMVTVTFRPLLIRKIDAEALLANTSGGPSNGNAILLADIKMPRYDVPSTLLLDSEDVFQGYLDILSASFISSVKTVLSDSWTKLNPLLVDDYPTDPFTGMESAFDFLHSGAISQNQVLNLQYFYDFFSDLLLGYDELKRKAFDAACECVPDESLFPRHLLLGEAVGFDELNSLFRTRFISSPILCCCADDTGHIRTLFKRLVLMIENLSLINSDNEAFRKNSAPIRITPSLLGKDPLSEKAIPFYYNVNEGPDPLYLSWNRERTERGTAGRILSYKASEYNNTDDFVLNPLKYDLEPSNFLRVEGHIGKDFRVAVEDIQKQRLSSRLPIEIVALSSDTRGIFSITEALTTMDTTGSITPAFEILLKHPACFADIFLALDEWINKLRCCLMESSSYYRQLPSFSQRGQSTIRTGASATGAVAGNTFHTIGDLYAEKLADGTLNDKFCSDVFVEISTSKAHHATALVMMPYKIDSMLSSLPDHITKLDAKALETRLTDITATSSQLRTMYASENVAGTMTGVDMVLLSSKLEMNCLTCLFAELRLLIREFLIRLIGLMLRQKLGFFAHLNPGIQHKAGVPMGGTFILVYHEESEIRRTFNRDEVLTAARSIRTKGGNTATGLFSGDQALLSSILLLEELLFLQKVKADTDPPNEILDGIVGTLKEGTVIADFYLPYLFASDCAPSRVLILPSPEETNKPPVADAGPDQSVVFTAGNDVVTLDGSNSSDPDGDPITYGWTQIQGPNNPAIANSDQPVTTVSGFVSGEYEFQLTVKDVIGDTGTDTVKIQVKIEDVFEKTCGPLADILLDFEKWKKLLKKNPEFNEGIFPSLNDVLEYFKMLTGIKNETFEKQTDFFAAGFNGLSTQEVFIRWLSELHNIIQERKDLRLLALMLYRILINLSMYIVCIQKDDFDQAKAPMNRVFEAFMVHLKTWIGLIEHNVFTSEEIAVVKSMGEDMIKELQRVDANGENGTKPHYVESLKQLVELILSLP